MVTTKRAKNSWLNMGLRTWFNTLIAMIGRQPLAAALLIALFLVSGLQSANLASPFSKGIASLMCFRECGRVRRKQTRRSLRFLSLTLAFSRCRYRFCKAQKPRWKTCFLRKNFYLCIHLKMAKRFDSHVGCLFLKPVMYARPSISVTY
jgi:hypothetical protein